MLKKSFISIGLVIIFIIIVEILISRQSKIEEKNTNIVENQIDISSSYVTDECVNEWDDYTTTVQEEIEETSDNMSDENKTYILKEKNNFIAIYYINENKEEILYKVTEISTEYLEKEDVEKLKKGIEIKGIQKLQQLLEDFE